MAKKILKVLLSALYLVGLIFEIYTLCKGFGEELLLFIFLSIIFFLFHLAICIAPKKFFDLCWKMSKYYPDNFDYDTGYRNVGNVGFGSLIAAIIFLGIGLLFIV